MTFTQAIRNMSMLQRVVIGSMATNVLLAASSVMLAYGTLANKERIMLIPPYLDEKVEVAWNSASKEYIKSFGLYVASMIGNIQPKTAPFVIDSISAFMAPSVYIDFRRQVMSIIDDPVFKSSGAIITFQPNGIQFEPETSRVFVTGTLITKSSRLDQQKTVTYEIGVRILEGRPVVTHFTSYEGAVPHTVSWHVNNAERDGKPIPDYATPKKVASEKPNFSANDLPAIPESSRELQGGSNTNKQEGGQ